MPVSTKRQLFSIDENSTYPKVNLLNKDGLILHLQTITTSADENPDTPADVTPKTSILMKYYGQTQPIVRAWQFLVAKHHKKAIQVLANSYEPDELVLKALALWFDGDSAKALNTLGEALTRREKIGLLFRKFSIPMILEIQFPQYPDNHEFHFFHNSELPLFLFLYGVIAMECGKYFLYHEAFKKQMLLNPDDRTSLLLSTFCSDSTRHDENRMSFFVSLTEKIGPDSPVDKLILFHRAVCQLNLKRTYPALFTIKNLDSDSVETEFDREIAFLQAEIHRKNGKKNEAERFLKKRGIGDSSPETDPFSQTGFSAIHS